MEKQLFVVRERELDQLDTFLGLALAGQGQVRFVAGEAGSGKTALISEFARRALEQHPDLVVAVGQGDAQTGAGDAYLPFREVLAQLTGDVEAKLAQRVINEENASRLRRLLRLSGQALVEVGPDLIGIFLPFAGLAARAAAFAADKAGWLDRIEQLAGRQHKHDLPGAGGIEQSHIFEQYTNVLRTLAAKQPLLLMLDDLQWADAGSIDLLFRLGRRIGGSRVLMVGTYRPAEVALGRAGACHPLEAVLAEFKRYFGDVTVDLSQAQPAEGRAFVDALLDSESNRLGENFRQALYERTGGHPLFTIELLRTMQERGDLVQDEQGYWVPRRVLDWETLPARVEGVIEERIGRLEEELRQVLTVASVQGEDFTAEVVARVRDIDARRLVRRLSGELAKRHRLVQLRGTQRLRTERLSLYRFRHNLFQRYLYGELDEVERAYLHEDVGSVLEELYADRADEIAVQLAFHFSAAELPERACPYLRRAGEQAAARFAHTEAIGYFSQALELTSQSELEQRFALLLAREQVYDFQGARQNQLQDLEALEQLAAEMGSAHQAELALRRARYAEATGNYPAAIAAAVAATQLAVELASSAESAAPGRAGTAPLAGVDRPPSPQEEAARVQATGYLQWGRALWRQGDYPAAWSTLEQALALAREYTLQRIEANSLRQLGVVCYYQSDYDQTRSFCEQARSLYDELGDRWGEGACLNIVGAVNSSRGRHADASAYYQQSLQIRREIGDRRGEGLVLYNLGVVSEKQGDYIGAYPYLEQALQVYQEIDNPWGQGNTLKTLGVVCDNLGECLSARAYYEQALQIFQETADREGEGAVLNNLGIVLKNMGDYEEAWAVSQQALQLRRELGNRQGESVALLNLGLLCDQLGDYAAAASYIQQSLQFRREINHRKGEAQSLAALALLAHHRGEDESAQAYAQQSLALAEEITDRQTQAYACTYLGHALAGLERADEALAAYRQAQELRCASGQFHLATESWAGLARVALAQGHLAQARTCVEEILGHLEASTPSTTLRLRPEQGSGHPLDGTDEPFRVYLTCYRVLKIQQDPRAPTILHTAYQLLQERAVKIRDEQIRHAFLNNVATHREILDEFTRDE